jgi:hypothetical protein
MDTLILLTLFYEAVFQGSEEGDTPAWPTETLLLFADEIDPRPFPCGVLAQIGSQKNAPSPRWFTAVQDHGATLPIWDNAGAKRASTIAPYGSAVATRAPGHIQ